MSGNQATSAGVIRSRTLSWPRSLPRVALYLLAWGLLPEASRARLTWTTWLVAATPLTVFVCVGAIVLLVLMFRPERMAEASRERVDLQFAVLGPPSRREIAVITEITEKTPMVIPNMVKPERNLFTRNEPSAIVMVSLNRISIYS